MAPPWLTTRASALGLAQAFAGAVAALALLLGEVAAVKWQDRSHPPPIDGLPGIAMAVGLAAFAVAVVLFRAGRRRVAPAAPAVASAGEGVLLAGSVAASAGTVALVAMDLRDRSSDAASITLFLGLCAILLGHLVLAFGLLPLRRLRPLAPAALLVVAAFVLFWLSLEDEYDGRDRPFLLARVGWALAWGLFHVLAGLLVAGHDPPPAPRGADAPQRAAE